MFTKKSYIKESSIHGVGCFAGEFIPKGSVIWRFQENFDVKLTDSQFEELPEIAKEFVLNFSYYSKEEGGYIVCMDNAKYTNHSDDANMKMFDKVSSIAIKDIAEGEEITEDYYYFDENASSKLGIKK